MRRSLSKFIGRLASKQTSPASTAPQPIREDPAQRPVYDRPPPDPPALAQAGAVNKMAQQPINRGTNSTLTIALENQSSSDNVYAYITGQSLDHGNALFLLQADGKSAYYPTSPSNTGSRLAENCAIKLGAPGTTYNVTIPHIAGGRIWFSINSTLTFLLNPGPALVEPSVTNPSDPNYNIEWDFCEFTYNEAQLFANISYVDFVSIPIALTLTGSSGTKHVGGMSTSGLTTVVDGLRAQQKKDGRKWGQLVVNGPQGQPLRALSPNAGHVLDNQLFERNGDYYANYVDQVWAKFSGNDLNVDTQASYGTLSGRVRNDVLTFSDGSTFAKPSAADIFSCSTGPFGGGSPSKLALIPRVAAALNRSTLLTDSDQTPGGEKHADFYKNAVTNHYARIVHAANVDGRGYAFPYDDVTADGFDNAGTVFDGSPSAFKVTVGGKNAYA